MKYPRKYGAQAWKYPWICRRNATVSGLDPTVAGEDVELPIISGPLSTTNLRPNVDIVPVVAILREPALHLAFNTGFALAQK